VLPKKEVWVYQSMMGILQEIRAVTTGLPAPELLRYLLKDRFPGETVVTASLKAPSVVVLKMVSDIDPATPIVFCHPRPVYPESESYRKKLIDLFGLTNVTVKTESDPINKKYPFSYYEKILNEYECGGVSTQTLQLNETVSNYRCWIKAVYHERVSGTAGHRIDIYGGKIIVDLLHRRSPEKVDLFMKQHGIPYHPKIRHLKKDSDIPATSDKDEIGYYF
jgi:phosphoadenosine phosphosulfate reductase